ncbi:MAG: TonB family protein [Ignavibacteriaceae bacterium]|nr:TonB family protein [Ignavibacteriaceae bacterium]
MIFIFCSIHAQDGLLKSYYPNGKIQSEINFRDSIRDGEAKYYSEDGVLIEERIYNNGKIEGPVKIYSSNGKLKEIFIIENGRREGPTSIYDENGNFLMDIYYESGKLLIPAGSEELYASTTVNNGNRTVEKISSDNETTLRTESSNTNNSELSLPPILEEEKQENNDTYLSDIEVLPEPVGGMESIYKKLIYPSAAKKNNVIGVVKIQAYIDEYGEVNDALVVEGIGSGCDDVARNAIYFARFKPGVQRGKIVKSTLIIPIKFNPQMNQN